MFEKYGIQKKPEGGRLASTDGIKYAADFGLDPTGLLHKKTDSDDGQGTPVKNKNANPMAKHGLPLRKTGDLPRGHESKHGLKNPLMAKRVAATAATSKATSTSNRNPWDEPD